MVGGLVLLAGVLASVVLAGLGGSPPPIAAPSGLPAPVDASAGGDWEVGACAAPDPARPPDGYLVVGCDAPEAVARVTAVGPASFVDEPECPSGTDLIIDVANAFGGGDGGVPTGTACLRNLVPPHPGDRAWAGGS